MKSRRFSLTSSLALNTFDFISNAFSSARERTSGANFLSFEEIIPFSLSILFHISCAEPFISLLKFKSDKVQFIQISSSALFITSFILSRIFRR